MDTIDDRDLALVAHLNHVEFHRLLARLSGRRGALVETDGVLLCAAACDFPVLFNSATRLDPTLPATEVIAIADRHFGGLGRGYSVSVRDDLDADLRAHAEQAGLLTISAPPEMVVTAPVADVEVPAGVELRWVDDAAGLADFLVVSEAAYATLGMAAGVATEAITDVGSFVRPDIHTVVAHLDGEPVAAAQTMLSHGIAGVYWVGTRDAARGRGLGDLVTRAVTNRAFDLGARANTLQASHMGEPIYARMGYRVLYTTTTLSRLEAPRPS